MLSFNVDIPNQWYFYADVSLVVFKSFLEYYFLKLTTSDLLFNNNKKLIRR